MYVSGSKNALYFEANGLRRSQPVYPLTFVFNGIDLKSCCINHDLAIDFAFFDHMDAFFQLSYRVNTRD